MCILLALVMLPVLSTLLPLAMLVFLSMLLPLVMLLALAMLLTLTTHSLPKHAVPPDHAARPGDTSLP